MRAIMRFLGFLAVVGGFVALVVDMTLFMANNVWRFTTLLDALNAVAPGAGTNLASAASNLAGAIGGGAVMAILETPALIAGLGGGLLLMFVFRRRNTDDMQDL